MIKIKNSKGDFVDFSGVRKTRHSRYVKVSFTDESLNPIICSLNHRFIVNSLEIYGHELYFGDSLAPGFVVKEAEIIDKEIELYDPVEVAETHSFIHDGGLVSHNCSFLGSSQTLVSADAILALKAVKPIKTRGAIKYFKEAVEGHRYIMMVDVSKGRGQDYSTFNVIDVSTSPFEQVCTFRDNNISPLLFPDPIVKVAQYYNTALLLVENNDAGHVVCNIIYHEYEYENMFVESAVKAMGVGVSMTKRVKRIGCSNLKDLIEGNKLTIYDEDTILEISTFEAKGDSFAATGDNHDDLVMNLVLFAWFTSTSLFQEESEMGLRELLFRDRIEESEHDLIPFGFISTGVEETPSMAIYQEMIDNQKEWDLL